MWVEFVVSSRPCSEGFSPGPGCSKPEPRISENFDLIFVAFLQGVLFIFFALKF